MSTFKKTTVVSDPSVTPVPEVRTEAVVTQTDTESNLLIDKINEIIYVIFSILSVLLLVRFVLLALGANRVGIVDFIYNVSGFFVAPFIGIFGRTTIYGAGYFEWETIVAIIFYMFAAWGITSLINLFRDN